MLKEIEQRRSCRDFDSNRMVETSKIEEVINAGLHAASAMNTQEGIIICITNKDVRHKLMNLNASLMDRLGTDPFYDAPVILLVAVKKWKNAVYDGSSMIENMLIEATNQGLGSCWIHRAKEELETVLGREILSSTNLNLEEYEGIGHVALGYSKSGKYKEKQIKDNRVYWIK